MFAQTSTAYTEYALYGGPAGIDRFHDSDCAYWASEADETVEYEKMLDRKASDENCPDWAR